MKRFIDAAIAREWYLVAAILQSWPDLLGAIGAIIAAVQLISGDGQLLAWLKHGVAALAILYAAIKVFEAYRARRS